MFFSTSATISSSSCGTSNSRFGDLQGLAELFLPQAKPLDLFVGEHQGFDHDLFRHLLGLALDHADRFFGAGDDQVQLGFATLVIGRIDDVFAVDQTDANARDRVVERNVRQIKCTRRTGDRDHVRIVFGVRRDDRCDDLRFKPVTVRKQRADRPVDHTAGQDFLFGRAAFAAEVVSGNAAGRVDGFSRYSTVSGKKSSPSLAVRAANGRDEQHRVAVSELRPNRRPVWRPFRFRRSAPCRRA